MRDLPIFLAFVEGLEQLFLCGRLFRFHLRVRVRCLQQQQQQDDHHVWTLVKGTPRLQEIASFMHDHFDGRFVWLEEAAQPEGDRQRIKTTELLCSGLTIETYRFKESASKGTTLSLQSSTHLQVRLNDLSLEEKFGLSMYTCHHKGLSADADLFLSGKHATTEQRKMQWRSGTTQHLDGFKVCAMAATAPAGRPHINRVQLVLYGSNQVPLVLEDNPQMTTALRDLLPVQRYDLRWSLDDKMLVECDAEETATLVVCLFMDGDNLRERLLSVVIGHQESLQKAVISAVDRVLVNANAALKVDSSEDLESVLFNKLLVSCSANP
ncbi:hypothetical protein CAPTEDRAFT_217022 [Capitella teleta]|uniref:Uncharacterized protein n=1 Tax=Capitella teleta TaxID=283909 RepID=R7URI1_CAPTE|nr:hypothetical protein CAPTEDRAFT_217022 [Capitella teleta]|eukprot:ELU08748.1 hypothetical protein CAPTEDRAFT_217022 [Capitella teleta]